MVEMGFFKLTGDRYQMTIPENLDRERVMQAHLRLQDENWVLSKAFWWGCRVHEPEDMRAYWAAWTKTSASPIDEHCCLLIRRTPTRT